MLTKAIWIAVGAALTLPAQSVIPAKAGLVSRTEGEVYVDGQKIAPTAGRYSAVKENAVVRTEAGRAEVLLGPCAAMWIGENSSFRMLGNRLIDTRIELLSGSAVIAASALAKESKLSLVMESADVSVMRKGSYRFDASPSLVKVALGKIAVNGLSVGAGRMLLLAEGEVRKFNMEARDSLDRWSTRRSAYLARVSGWERRQERTGVDLAAVAEAASADGPARPPRIDSLPTFPRPGRGPQFRGSSLPPAEAGQGCAVSVR